MAVPRRSAPPAPGPCVPTASQGYADVSELDKYKLISNIGKGSFGVISKVQRVEDGKEFAMKQLDYSKMPDKDRRQILAEVAILSNLKHKNIVQLVQKIFDPNKEHIYIVMEYCTSGDLGSLIRKAQRSNQPLNEDKIWNIFLQIVLALHHCHWPESRGSKASRASGPSTQSASETRYQVLHRDLKPENVFLSDDFVKLGDFGLSKDMGTASFTSTYVGTPLYMPPEILAENRYDTKSDIWSLGCLVFELCALASPFSTAQTQPELITMVKSGRLPPLPAHISTGLKSVIRAMLNLNPIKRPSTRDLLEIEEMKMHRKLFALQNQTSLLLIRREELSKMETVLQNRRSGLEEREKILEAREATLTQREAAIASREEEAKETQKRLNVAAETLRSQWDRLMEEKERDKLFGVGPSGGQDDRAAQPLRRGSTAPQRPPLEERNTLPNLPVSRQTRGPMYDETPSKIPISTFSIPGSPAPLSARLEALQVGHPSAPTPLRRNNTKSLGNLKESARQQMQSQAAFASTDATPAKQRIPFPKAGRVSIGSPSDLRQVWSEDISMASPGMGSPWVARPRKSSTDGGGMTSSGSDIAMDSPGSMLNDRANPALPPTMIPAPIAFTYRETATPAKYSLDDPDLPSPFIKRYPSDPGSTTVGGGPVERQILGSINIQQLQQQPQPFGARKASTSASGANGHSAAPLRPSKSGGLVAQVLRTNANNAAAAERERRISGTSTESANGIQGVVMRSRPGVAGR